MITLIFIAAMMITLISFGALSVFAHFGDGISLIGAAALGVGAFLAMKPQKDKKFELDLGSDNINELSRQSFQKAVDDYNYIKSVFSKTRDAELKRQILNMQETSGNILQYLKQHPEKIPSARRFIDYYQDSAAKMLEKFLELESTRLKTQEVESIKTRTKETLCDLETAYTEQFNKIINDQIMDMDAELKVMNQTMKAEGFSRNESSEEKESAFRGKTKMKDVEGFSDFSPRKNRRSGLYRQYRGFCERHGGLLYDDGSPSMRRDILKRKLIAGGLGIVFGGFGAHKFYLGRTGWGVLYLIFAWTGIPFIVGFIEGIRYLFMSYDEFLFKYC